MNDCPKEPNEATLDQELALMIEYNESAQRKWVLRLLDHALARLYFARRVRATDAAHEQVMDAADTLYVAACLADPPKADDLMLILIQIRYTLRYIGHPSKDELESIEREVMEIRKSCPMA